MAENKVNRENFIALQGFMISDLKLKGNELIIYACIYGFSQAENQVFSGSLQYLADWTNSTKQGVIKCLKSLTEKGFIKKNERIINGVKFCEYYATKFNTPIQQSLTGGIQQSLPNNIDINNISNNKEKKERKQGSFDNIIDSYLSPDGKSERFQDHAERRELLQEWLKVRKAKRAAMTDRAIQMNIEKLDDLARQSKMSVTEYLREIICRGWAAFYVIKNYDNGKPAPAKVGANGIAISSEASELDGVF